MSIHSGRRTGEPNRVIHGRAKRPPAAVQAGSAAKPSPEAGLPRPMTDLIGRVRRLEDRVTELERALKERGHRGQ